jgi:tetratricopeptide (TPR) repeat protein
LVGYLVKLLAPVRLSALYLYPAGDLPGLFLLAPVGALGLVLGTLWCVRRARFVAFGMLFYLVNVLLVLQLISVGQAVMADRYTYLAYVGPLFVLGVLYVKAASRSASAWKHGLTAGMCVLSILSMHLTFERCRVWKDSEALWTDVLEKQPGSYLAHYNRGTLYLSQGNDQMALGDFDRAISLRADYAEAYNNRGAIRYRRGQSRLAVADFDQAIRHAPDFAEAYFNRGRVYMAGQADERALRDYTRAVELEPGLAPAYNNRASIHFKRGDYESALKDYDRAVRLEPANAGLLLNRSLCYDALGRTAPAYRDALKARQLGAGVDARYLERLARSSGR